MSLNKNKSWKVLLVSLAAALSLSVLSACSSSNNNSNSAVEDTSKAVATYKDGTITENEFDLDTRVMKFLSPEQAQYLEIDSIKEAVLKQAVAFEYLATNATDEAKAQAEKDADEQMDSIKTALGDTYASSLEEQNLTEAQIRSYMVRMFTVFQDMQLKITDDQVEAEFEATKGDYTVATVRHVLIGLTDADGNERTDEDALKLANEVKAKLEGGADFAEIAKEYSDDTDSKDTGGEYKDATLGTYVEEFKQAAQTLPLNTISDPVKTSYGYHIMEVEARTETTFDKLTDEEKETIKNTLATNNLETFLDTELDSLEIEINLPESSAAADESGTTDSGAEATEAPSASPAATEAAE